MDKLFNRREFLKRSILAAATLPGLHPVIAAASRDAIRRTGAARKVIVIGAGLAGLSSAYELTQAGHDVTVLEARTRSGGRVWTLRDSFPEGLYAEAGATNVFDNHVWAMKYVKELGVALGPMEFAGGSSIFHMRGKRIVICSRAGNLLTLAADYLICAIPFAVLKRVEVSPGFSPQKQRAVAQLGNTSVARVFLQTRKRFWLDEGLSGAATTDLPIMTAYDKAHYLPGKRGLLEAYLAGERARLMAGLKSSERLDFTVMQMERILPAIHEHYEGGASVCWDEDEWARGAYAWFKPGQMESFLPHLARPEGRVHFAGDHTSPWPGWMNGALQSGARYARS